MQELKVTQVQLQAVIGQNAEILEGVDRIGLEVEKLRTEMGSQVGLLDAVEHAIASVKGKTGLSKKRVTGPLKELKEKKGE